MTPTAVRARYAVRGPLDAAKLAGVRAPGCTAGRKAPGCTAGVKAPGCTAGAKAPGCAAGGPDQTGVYLCCDEFYSSPGEL